MASTVKATSSSSSATTILRSSGHNNENANIVKDDNNTSRRNNFVKRVKDTMQTISEWAKDTDNKHINPICGNIENTFLSILDPQPSNLSLNNNQSNTVIGSTSILSSKSISKKGGTTTTSTSDTFVPDSSGYVVDSGRMQISTSDAKKSSTTHNSKRHNDLFCLAFTNISQCTPSIFLSKGRNNSRSSSAASNIQNRLLCKGIAGCTSLDDIPLREQVSSYGYDPYYEKYLEAENLQMQRLASWGTYGTAETFNTDCNQSISINDSVITATSGNNGTNGTTSSSSFGVQQRDAYDDDGNIIDSKIMEGTRKQMEKVKKLQQQQKLASSTTTNQRNAGNTSTSTPKRVVQFEYPPITSLRQCPRTDPDDISQLFFSEEELDMYEDDRRSTFTVDDVEIVAISTSLSEDNNPIIKGTIPTTATEKRIPGGAVRRPGTPRPITDTTATSSTTTNNDNTTATKRGSTSSSSSSSTNKKSSRQLPALNTGTDATIATAANTATATSEKSTRRRSTTAATTTTSSPASTPRPGTPVASSHRHGTPRPNSTTVITTSFPTNQSLTSSSSSQIDTSTHFPLSQQQHPIDHNTIVDDNNTSQHLHETSSVCSTSTSKKRDKRLLKSVQIYLRERSTGL